ncbi:MAG: hypothetical protein HKN23_01940 [Verrucomicrobiales bacterium]|nr:hypothetical protein [Verrucomicrobiales bacterium]
MDQKIFSPWLTAVAVALLFTPAVVQADTITLKDGTVLEGKIVLEADDFVKIEMESKISATIKDSKLVDRKTIASIKKASPDEEAFEKIKNLVPTRSLMPASEYKDKINTGPKAFIEQYPNSVHRSKVDEILTVLTEELDKVERGSQKIDGVWYSPQDRRDFPMFVNAEKRYYAIKTHAGSKNLAGYIEAMRAFEALEENELGTPAHAKAVKGVKNLLPLLEVQAKRALRNVHVRNEAWEKGKGNLPIDEQQRVIAAKEREEASFKRAAEADRKNGIKWVRVNINSPQSLEACVALIADETARLESVDADVLAARAEKLHGVDRMLAKGQLIEAQDALEKILEEDSQAASSGTSNKKRRSTKKSSVSTDPSTYVEELKLKISQKQEAIAAAEAAKAAAAKSNELVQNTKGGDDPAKGDEGKGEESKGEETEKGSEETEKSGTSSFAQLAQSSAKSQASKNKGESDKSTKSSSKKSKDKPKPKPERPRTAAADDGGGIPFHFITLGIAAILGIAIFVMKKMGIGGTGE